MTFRKSALIAVATAGLLAGCAVDQPDSGGSTSPTEASASRTKNAALNLACAAGGDCKFGDTGPGGGIVFYDAGSNQPWGRYLEVAKPLVSPSMNWCDQAVLVFDNPRGFRSKAYEVTGRGFLNTKAAAEGCKSGAVRAAWDWVSGGKEDWFLPTADEARMISSLSQPGTVNRLDLPTEETFWTSSEYLSTSANVLNGHFITTWNKVTKQAAVRAVRAFLPGDKSPFTTTTIAASTTTVAPTTSSSITPTTVDTSPPGNCTTTKCRIGDRGPSGGVVFITPATTGNTNGWFFEAKPGDFLYSQPFGCGTTEIPGTGVAIGDGPSNTAKILHFCGANSILANYPSVAIGATWFMPSADELREVFKNLSILKGKTPFKWGEFWTSTVSDAQSMYAANANLTDVVSMRRRTGYDAIVIAAFKADLSPVKVLDKPRAYDIGAEGPGGGKVFITPSTPGNTTGKFFEVAPTNWSGTPIGDGNLVFNPQVAWSCNEYRGISVAGLGTAIGTGTSNTKVIKDACVSTKFQTPYAADAASKYRGGGRSDWFVPSRDELDLIYKNVRSVAPGLLTQVNGKSSLVTCAWSSSEKEPAVGFGGNQILPTGELASLKSISTNCVLPVRMFDATESFGPKG